MREAIENFECFIVEKRQQGFWVFDGKFENSRVIGNIAREMYYEEKWGKVKKRKMKFIFLCVLLTKNLAGKLKFLIF